MEEVEGVTICDGVVTINHPEIEAQLLLLASRLRMEPGEALVHALRSAIAREGEPA